FLRNYQYHETGTLGGSAFTNQSEPFLLQWFETLGRVAQFDGASGNLAAYKAIYDGYGFDDTLFNARLKEFYDQQSKQYGFFVPSYGLSSWFQQMRDDYTKVTSTNNVAVLT